MKSLICTFEVTVDAGKSLTYRNRRASEDSILAIQIFDQKKFKKKDQGFLGVINVRIGDVIDLDVGGEGIFTPFRRLFDIS